MDHLVEKLSSSIDHGAPVGILKNNPHVFGTKSLVDSRGSSIRSGKKMSQISGDEVRLG
jgi:hypothetical protein